MENEIFDLADNYRKLREKKDEQAAVLKEITAAVEKAEEALADAMINEDCSNLTRGGKQFVMTTTTRWSADKDRKEELYETLRIRGYDHLFTVNAQTLGSFIKEQTEMNSDEENENYLPEWLSGLVKSYDDVGVTMKPANKKSKS